MTRPLRARPAWPIAAALAGVVWAAAPAAERPGTPDIASLLDRYLAGDRAAADLRRDGAPEPLVRALETGGAAWVGRDPARLTVRRLAAAAFALEAAHALLDGARWPLSRRLIAWGCTGARAAGADPGARWWFLASTALLQRVQDWDVLAGLDPRARRLGSTGQAALDAELAVGHVAHARLAFPGEPRFELARLVAAEHRLWAGATPGGAAGSLPVDLDPAPGAPGPARGGPAHGGAVRTLAEGLDALARREGAAGEARLRLGVLRFRLGEFPEALGHLGSAATDADPHVRYLANLFGGLVQERRGDPADAAARYEAALDAFPGAQSATVRLVAVLFGTDRQDAAAVVVSRFFAAPPAPDPWRGYARGDARHWPAYLSALREALR